MRQILAVLLLVSSPTILGQDSYDRFLIPLYVRPVTGAYGTTWTVETWVMNSGIEPIRVIPEISACRVGCMGIGQLLNPSPPLQLDPEYAVGGGLLFHVDANQSSSIEINSRVRDVRGTSAGTELPIVPERAFRATSLHLLNIPLRRELRAALRIYALPETAAAPAEAEVRFFRMFRRNEGGSYIGDAALLWTQRVLLTSYPPTQGFNLHPAFAMLGAIETIPGLREESSIWVQVVPLTPGMRVWAMLSLTNNTTQEVTVVTPVAYASPLTIR